MLGFFYYDDLRIVVVRDLDLYYHEKPFLPYAYREELYWSQTVESINNATILAAKWLAEVEEEGI